MLGDEAHNDLFRTERKWISPWTFDSGLIVTQ